MELDAEARLEAPVPRVGATSNCVRRVTRKLWPLTCQVPNRLPCGRAVISPRRSLASLRNGASAVAVVVGVCAAIVAHSVAGAMPAVRAVVVIRVVAGVLAAVGAVCRRWRRRPESWPLSAPLSSLASWLESWPLSAPLSSLASWLESWPLSAPLSSLASWPESWPLSAPCVVVGVVAGVLTAVGAIVVVDVAGWNPGRCPPLSSLRRGRSPGRCRRRGRRWRRGWNPGRCRRRCRHWRRGWSPGRCRRRCRRWRFAAGILTAVGAFVVAGVVAAVGAVDHHCHRRCPRLPGRRSQHCWALSGRPGRSLGTHPHAKDRQQNAGRQDDQPFLPGAVDGLPGGFPGRFLRGYCLLVHRWSPLSIMVPLLSPAGRERPIGVFSIQEPANGGENTFGCGWKLIPRTCYHAAKGNPDANCRETQRNMRKRGIMG